MSFENRGEASKVLIDRIKRNDIDFDELVAISPGGLLIAEKLADEFNVSINLVEVKELRAEDYPGFSFGAIADDGTIWIEDEIRDSLGINSQDIEKARLKEVGYIRERLLEYGFRDTREISGKRVLLVDQGARKRMRLMAALGFLRKRGPEELAVAMPVASRNVVIDIKEVSDKCLILNSPRFMSSVESFYDSLEDVSDNKIRRILG